MGLTHNQLLMIRAICENKMADVKKLAIVCLKEDTTAKNAAYVKRYLNILENSDTGLIELPYKLKGMLDVQDSTNFRVDRYYLSKNESELADRIEKLNKAGIKLMEMGIPYLNSILLTGVSGTGKTTFGRYIAHRLNLPFLYVNFSYLIDSYMGGTSKNIREVFDYARLNKSLLMLDEIDAIGSTRNTGSSGADKERSNATISILQELDKVQNDSLIIGATNIPEDIDPAIKRRFAIHHEIKPFTKEQNYEMIEKYLKTTELKYDIDNIQSYVNNLKENTPQAIILNHTIECIANTIIEDKTTVIL